MSAEDRIARCTTRLLLARPWWSSLLLHLKVTAAPIPTMAVDGVHLFFNPDFVDGLPIAELEGVLCHEVGHCALLHMTRRGRREPELWNIACDAAVNALLAADNIPLPAGSVPPADVGLTAEDIYADMLKSAKHIKLPMQDLATPASAAQSTTKTEDKWRAAVAQAAGLLPGALQRPVENAQESRLPWQEILARFIIASVRSDNRSWTRASRRLPGLMPGWMREPATEIAIIIDTSGSVTGDLLAAFSNEARSIFAMQNVSAYLLAADAAIGLTVEPGQPFPAHLPGGGGTDFRPALTACEKRDSVVAVVYFTDGCGTFPATCQKPVLWLLSERGPISPPFGSVVYLT